MAVGKSQRDIHRKSFRSNQPDVEAGAHPGLDDAFDYLAGAPGKFADRMTLQGQKVPEDVPVVPRRDPAGQVQHPSGNTQIFFGNILWYKGFHWGALQKDWDIRVAVTTDSRRACMPAGFRL